MNNKYFLVIITLLISCQLSGCRTYRTYVTGTVDAEISEQSLAIKYDLQIKDSLVDSVALQVLTPGNNRKIIYWPEERVKDSLYDLLGDSIRCCFDLYITSLKSFGIVIPPPAIKHDTSNGHICWWTEIYKNIESDSVLTIDTTQKSTWVNTSTFTGSPIYGHLLFKLYKSKIDSKMKLIPLDSLMKISVPCRWEHGDLDRFVENGLDTILQADSIIYSCNEISQTNMSNRSQKNRKNRIKFKGTLKYHLSDSTVPEYYSIKVYDKKHGEIVRHIDPPVWDDVFPKRPLSEKFRFAEYGWSLGALGGLGITKFNLSNTPIPVYSKKQKIDLNLTAGISYYGPRVLLSTDATFNGVSPPDTTSNRLSLISSSIPRISFYPFTRTSYGLSILMAFRYSTYEIKEDDNYYTNQGYGFKIGMEYETYFDRVGYSYHTNHGGYHQIDLLIGYEAIRQGKVGLKGSILFGNQIRLASLQLYMENRIWPSFIKPYSKRTFLTQSLIYAGMIAGWAILFN